METASDEEPIKTENGPSLAGVHDREASVICLEMCHPVSLQHDAPCALTTLSTLSAALAPAHATPVRLDAVTKPLSLASVRRRCPFDSAQHPVFRRGSHTFTYSVDSDVQVPGGDHRNLMATDRPVSSTNHMRKLSIGLFSEEANA
ncbi:hypothetical protein A0H81_00097 [Grifola frondosa]|uniref:Uncharacterized protein n=1 Tax=Grifola frondosa TaxID=5627 RepID=A0A1C7MRW7_GRIFR|nr:hypothetical protein A0H81_00097 [Grifola frondosa]